MICFSIENLWPISTFWAHPLLLVESPSSAAAWGLLWGTFIGLVLPVTGRHMTSLRKAGHAWPCWPLPLRLSKLSPVPRIVQAEWSKYSSHVCPFLSWNVSMWYPYVSILWWWIDVLSSSAALSAAYSAACFFAAYCPEQPGQHCSDFSPLSSHSQFIHWWVITRVTRAKLHSLKSFVSSLSRQKSFRTNEGSIQNAVKRWKSRSYRSCSWPQHLLLTARLPQPQLPLMVFHCLQTTKTCINLHTCFRASVSAARVAWGSHNSQCGFDEIRTRAIYSTYQKAPPKNNDQSEMLLAQTDLQWFPLERNLERNYFGASFRAFVWAISAASLAAASLAGWCLRTQERLRAVTMKCHMKCQ